MSKFKSRVRLLVGRTDVEFEMGSLIDQAQGSNSLLQFLELFCKVAEGRGSCSMFDDTGIEHVLVEDEFATLDLSQIAQVRAAYVDALYEDCLRDPGMLRDVLDERAEGTFVGDMLDYLNIHDGEAAQAVLDFDPWVAGRHCEVCQQPATCIERHSAKPLVMYLCGPCHDILFDMTTFVSPRSRREIEIDGGMMQWRDV